MRWSGPSPRPSWEVFETFAKPLNMEASRVPNQTAHAAFATRPMQPGRTTGSRKVSPWLHNAECYSLTGSRKMSPCLYSAECYSLTEVVGSVLEARSSAALGEAAIAPQRRHVHRRDRTASRRSAQQPTGCRGHQASRTQPSCQELCPNLQQMLCGFGKETALQTAVSLYRSVKHTACCRSGDVRNRTCSQ